MTQVILITSPIIKKITYKRPSISRIRRRKSTQVFCLPSTCLAFCLPTHVCWLASTYDECVDFGRSQSWRKFFTVWPPSQFGRSRSQVICIIVKFSTFATCVNLLKPFGQGFTALSQVDTDRKRLNKLADRLASQVHTPLKSSTQWRLHFHETNSTPGDP